jgi:hypothetical protein
MVRNNVPAVFTSTARPTFCLNNAPRILLLLIIIVIIIMIIVIIR